MVGLGGQGPRLTSHSSFLAISLFFQLNHSAIYLIHSFSPNHSNPLFFLQLFSISYISTIPIITYTLTNIFYSYILFPYISQIIIPNILSHSTTLYLLYSLPILHSLYSPSAHSIHLLNQQKT